MIQSRWKSKVLWASIASLVAFLLTQYGLWHWIGMEESSFTQFVDMVLVILGMIGVVNNPTNPVGL